VGEETASAKNLRNGEEASKLEWCVMRPEAVLALSLSLTDSGPHSKLRMAV
jgi:hypothetical protein